MHFCLLRWWGRESSAGEFQRGKFGGTQPSGQIPHDDIMQLDRCQDYIHINHTWHWDHSQRSKVRFRLPHQNCSTPNLQYDVIVNTYIAHGNRIICGRCITYEDLRYRQLIHSSQYYETIRMFLGYYVLYIWVFPQLLVTSSLVQIFSLVPCS